MAFSIVGLMVNSGPELYYSDKWVRTIKDHAKYLRELQSTQVVTVTPDVAQANLGNYVGLLNDLKIPQELHYVIAIVNGWERNEDVGTVTHIYVPTEAELGRIRKLLPST